MRIYLAMAGKQKTVTMIHMLGTFYLIRALTNAYQGKVLGFVGNQRATKEPTPICLPQVKAWQWYAGHVNMDKEDFTTFFDDEANKNKWWSPSSAMTRKGRAPGATKCDGGSFTGVGRGVNPSRCHGGDG